MSRYLLKNATIVTGSSCARGGLGIDGDRIAGIWYQDDCPFPEADVINLGGKLLMAGMIDPHVHFREPGLTWKACIESESRAALLGGVTSFIDMPNTSPPTVSKQALEEKLSIGASSSYSNYGFHLGATNGNAGAIKEYLDEGLGCKFAGIKVFMGSSTGNMLVDREEALKDFFQIKGKPILVHCEDEGMIRANLESAKQAFGNDIPFSYHPMIRSREACIKSTAKALEMAVKYGTALHVLHVSTAEEVEMIREAKTRNPYISSETSANYLWFCDKDYPRLQGLLKCNPSVKTRADREALRRGLADGTIDILASDHAPHLLSEKGRSYPDCPSGVPSAGQTLSVAITIAQEYGIPYQRIAGACSEKTAELFGVVDRGNLKAGCFADLVVIDPDKESEVCANYKCGWSPYDGTRLKGKVEMVWLNGLPVVTGGSNVCAGKGQFQPQPLQFRPIG